MTRDRSSHPRSRGRVAQPVPLSSGAVGLDQLASCPEWLWRVRSGGARHSERRRLYRRARRPWRPGRASSRPEGTSRLNACWCIPLPRRRAGLKPSNGAFADQVDRNQGNAPLAPFAWRAGGAIPVGPKHLGARPVGCPVVDPPWGQIQDFARPALVAAVRCSSPWLSCSRIP